MSVYAPVESSLKTAAAKLDSTSLTDLYVVPASMKAVFESITFCNITSSADSFSLAYYDGTTTFYICNSEPLAGNTKFQITDHPILLSAGDKIQVQAATADRIDVVAVVHEAKSLR